jgi:hypothetical protein
MYISPTFIPLSLRLLYVLLTYPPLPLTLWVRHCRSLAPFTFRETRDQEWEWVWLERERGISASVAPGSKSTKLRLNPDSRMVQE